MLGKFFFFLSFLSNPGEIRVKEFVPWACERDLGLYNLACEPCFGLIFAKSLGIDLGELLETRTEPSSLETIIVLTIYRSSLAPYERRVIELLRNSRDKRARKLAKKRVRTDNGTSILSPPCLVLLTHTFSSSELSAVPRRRSTSSSESSLSPAVPVTKYTPSSRLGVCRCTKVGGEQQTKLKHG